MVQQEDFKVERWMDEYETKVELNIAEVCCYSLSLQEVSEITNSPIPVKDIVTEPRMVYGPISGSDELRKEIADLTEEGSEENDGHKPIVPENVLVTNGGIGANFLVYYTLVDPGDHVIVVDPAYQQLPSVPNALGGTVDKLPLRPENGFLPDIDELKSLVVKGKTKLININNPHNPTGAVIPQDLLKQIVEIAREADAYLLCDEVYRPLYHSIPENMSEPSSIATLYEKGISTSSTSKSYGLAGFRLGWIVSPDQNVITECLKRRDYTTISVSPLCDGLSAWALKHRKQILDHNKKLCVRNLNMLDEFVKASNGALTYVKPQGSTSAFIYVPGAKGDTKSLCRELAEKYSALLVPGETFGKPGYFRIGYGNRTEDLSKGLDRLKKLMLDTNRVPENYSGWKN